MYLEKDMQDLRLEHERMNRIYSSSFYHLGMIQVHRDKAHAKKARGAGGTGDAGDGPIDWLDS